jgi:hypothetical protein
MTKKQYAGLVASTFFAGLIGGAAMSWFLTSHPALAQKRSPPESIVEAKSFHLIDKNGNLRGGLTILDDGTAGLLLANKNTKSAIKLIVGPNGKSGITVYDNNGTGRAMFTVEPDGTPGLRLQSSSKSLAALGFNSDGSPSLNFWDREGKQRAVLGGIVSNAARIDSVGKRPVSSLILLDKDERIIWEAP